MSTGTPSREPQTCVCVGASCDVLNNVVQEVFRKPSLLLSRTALIPVIQTVAGWHFFCATHYEAPRLQPVIAVDYISMTPAQSITRDNAELSTGLGTRNVPKTPFGVDSEPSGPKIERQSVSEALPHAKFFYQHDMITIWVCFLHIRTGFLGIIIQIGGACSLSCSAILSDQAFSASN